MTYFDRTSPAPNKIVFLDLHGVMFNYGFEFDPESVEALNEICESSGASIVITSTLRRSKSLKELQDLLIAAGVRVPVVGVAPVVKRTLKPEAPLRTSKGHVICGWLRRYCRRNNLDSFLILEDAEDTAPYGDKCVQVDHGLNLTHTTKAKEILNQGWDDTLYGPVAEMYEFDIRPNWRR